MLTMYMYLNEVRLLPSAAVDIVTDGWTDYRTATDWEEILIFSFSTLISKEVQELNDAPFKGGVAQLRLTFTRASNIQH